MSIIVPLPPITEPPEQITEPAPHPSEPEPHPSEPEPVQSAQFVSNFKYGAKLFSPKRELKQTHRVLLGSELKQAVPPSYSIVVPFAPYNQGPIGSCVANALCLAFKLQRPIGSTYDPSRLFLYYVTRARAGLIGQDGAYLDDGFKSLLDTGVCKEATWVYNTSKQNQRPPSNAYSEAKGNHITSWGVVSSSGGLVNNIKQVLVTNRVVTVGILVYQSFESYAATSTGMIPVPNTGTEALLGGHAIAIVGYDDSKSAFLAVNSWGTAWGTTQPSGPTNYRGFCYLPYAYIGNSNLCDEALFMTGVVIAPPPPPPPPRPKPRPPRRPTRRLVRRPARKPRRRVVKPRPRARR